MIEQYLSNINESAALFLFCKKKLEVNKAIVDKEPTTSSSSVYGVGFF